MKPYLYILIIVLTAFIDLGAQNPAYRLNDTMYIWEMHGADMIDDPAQPDQVKNKFYYGASARIVDVDIHRYPVSMEVNEGYELQGHWVKVIINRDTGYVFDGFLGAYQPFDLRSNAQGIELVLNNYPGSAQVSKAVRSFSEAGLENGESREASFENGIDWSIKHVKPCLVEKYSLSTRRFSEAYQFMMAVYSNYFDQEANYMAEPEFVRINGNKTDFILKGDGPNRQISLYHQNGQWVINTFRCSE